MKQWQVLKSIFPEVIDEEKVIQDFPIRGKAVFLHARRRKWRDISDGSIFTYNYELTVEGSKLTPGFVAFLKDADRV